MTDNEHGLFAEIDAGALTTALAVEAVAWERAPRYPSRTVNRRIVCADGFTVSVQASAHHYAMDSGADGSGPYWRWKDETPAYPFTTFEIGNPTEDPAPAEVWDEYDNGGVWAMVPRQVVADLLDLHGGAVAWESEKTTVNPPELRKPSGNSGAPIPTCATPEQDAS